MSGPRVVDVRASGTPETGTLTEVVWHVQEGGLLVYPTETVYGFGCRVEARALRRLRRLKRRPLEKPLLVLLPGTEAAAGLAWNADAAELSRAFWPGALTLVLGDPEGRFPQGVRSREGTVAVRVSPHPVVRALMEALGEPLTSTSANAPGGPPATDGAGAERVARSLGAGGETWVLDGGALAPSPPSTLVDCTGPRAVVIRPGAVPVERLRRILPGLRAPENQDAGLYG